MARPLKMKLLYVSTSLKSKQGCQIILRNWYDLTASEKDRTDIMTKIISEAADFFRFLKIAPHHKGGGAKDQYVLYTVHRDHAASCRGFTGGFLPTSNFFFTAEHGGGVCVPILSKSGGV